MKKILKVLAAAALAAALLVAGVFVANKAKALNLRRQGYSTDEIRLMSTIEMAQGMANAAAGLGRTKFVGWGRLTELHDNGGGALLGYYIDGDFKVRKPAGGGGVSYKRYYITVDKHILWWGNRSPESSGIETDAEGRRRLKEAAGGTD